MSRDFRYRLSKRSSMWESTSNLSNYSRPQGWYSPDISKKIPEVSEEELNQAILDILKTHYGSSSLDPRDMDSLLEYVMNASNQGYGLSYNKLNRLVGLWLTREFKPTQTEYDEGYQSLSWG